MVGLTTLSLCSLLGLAGAQIVKKPLVKDSVGGLSAGFEKALSKAPTFTVDKWTTDEGNNPIFPKLMHIAYSVSQ